MHIYKLEYTRSDGTISFYIGQSTKTPEESTDYWGSGDFCKNYIRGKGIEYVRQNVKKTILLRDLPNQEALDYWEKFSIRDYRDRFPNQVVNIADGGEGGNITPWTEERKKKISQTLSSPENKAKMSKRSKEIWKSPKHRARMVEVNEGENNPCYNATIYSFKNIKTGQTFVGTQHSFRTKYGFNKGGVNGLVKGRAKSNHGWVLDNPEMCSEEDIDQVINGYKDRTTYTLKNIKTGETYVGLRHTFIKTYGLNNGHVSLLLNKKAKSCKGWTLIADNKDKQNDN